MFNATSVCTVHAVFSAGIPGTNHSAYFEVDWRRKISSWGNAAINLFRFCSGGTPAPLIIFGDEAEDRYCF